MDSRSGSGDGIKDQRVGSNLVPIGNESLEYFTFY